MIDDLEREIVKTLCPGCMECPSKLSLFTGAEEILKVYQQEYGKLICQGTGLRWLSLSQQKEIVVGDPTSIDGVKSAVIRIADITLEKVLEMLEQEGYPNADFGETNTAMQAEGDMYQVDVVLPHPPWTHHGGKGPTRLKAACMVLLESIK